jgi:hypothetical protein
MVISQVQYDGNLTVLHILLQLNGNLMVTW